MMVLVACEESQVVCKAFRAKGHEAYSCDLQACSGGHPEWHLQMDCFEAIALKQWDLMIGHPPCTYLTNAGIGYFNIEKWGQKAIERSIKREQALRFFIAMYNAPIPKICLENPVGYVNSRFRKPNQTIQPHYFGDPQLKRTCLWLRGLSRLNGNHAAAVHPTHLKPEPSVIYNRRNGDGVTRRYFTDQLGPASRNATRRSKTFPGIAQAMADQWG